MLIALLPLLVSLVITIGVMAFTLQRQNIAGARPFALAMFLEAWWIATYTLELLSATLVEKTFWDECGYLGTLLLPLALISFAYEYSGRTMRHPRLAWGLLAALPAGLLLLIFTNPAHGLVITAPQIIQKEYFSIYTYDFSLLLWAGFIYAYLLSLMAILILLDLALHQQGVYRVQTALIICGLAIPLVGAALSLLGFYVGPHRDMTPYAFALGNLFIAVGLFRYHIFEIMPIVRDVLMESMEDGVIVLDARHHVVDINAAAEKMLAAPGFKAVGQPFASLPLAWARQVELTPQRSSTRLEVTVSLLGERHIYDLRITSLANQHGVFSGYLLLLRDISQRKRTEQALQDAYAVMEQRVAERTVELSRTVARLEAEIHQRKRGESELRRLNRALRVINACNQTLFHLSDENSLLQALCKIIVEDGGYPFAWIGYIAGSAQHFIQPASFYGAPPAYLEALQLPTITWEPGGQDYPAYRDAFQTLQPLVIADTRSDPNFAPFRLASLQFGFLSAIIFPLVFGQDTYGCLVIYGSETQAFDAPEIVLLSDLASDVSFGIHTRRMRASRDRAEQQAKEATDELFRAYESTLEGWSLALELREHETAGHSQRVVDLTLALACRMGVPPEQLAHIRRGALLHDIGKMGIPDSILLKPGSLDPEDWQVMRQHPQLARQLLDGIPYLEPALDIPYYHHERWDGSGYPLGLKGETIPMVARIFAVVDVWDALGSDRPYRPAWPLEQVAGYLADNAGKLLDPHVVAVFFELLAEKDISYA